MIELKNIIITDVTEVFSVKSPKGRAETINNRKTYGMSLCESGQITYTHKGKTFVSDNKHIVILLQNQSYLLSGDKTGMFPVINFTCLNFNTDIIIRYPISSIEPYISDFNKIKENILFPENRAKVIGIFYNMIHRLTIDNSIPKTLVPAIKYIEKNYHDCTLNNNTLAKVCNISEVYLRKMFLKHLKTTPKQYITEIRLTKANQLLSEGVLKVGAVAEKCGFTNPYHFCRLFKQKNGITPSAYIEQNRINKI